MSENIQQIYVANPTTAMVTNDLLYLGRSPYGASDDFAITWNNMQLSITAVGTVTAGIWNATTVAISHGGTGVTSVTTAPTAGAFAGWDTNRNLSADSFISGFTSTATAGATTTLTVNSAYIQEFTGSTTQTVVLPVTSTLVAGQGFYIINNSSGAVTVQSSGANNVQVMAASTSLYVTCIAITGTTAASWQSAYIVDSGLAGAVLLSPSGNQTITSNDLNLANGNMVSTAGYFFSGSTAGGVQGAITLYSPTAANGSTAFRASGNGGNFDSVLSNVSTSGARLWSLPDETGVIALVDSASSGYVRLTPLSDQAITVGFLQVAAGIIISGATAGGTVGGFRAYPTTTGTGNITLSAVDNSGNYTNTLTHAATSAGRTWTLPDATGTIALTGSSVASITGTVSQVLVNGTSGSPVTGAVTLTLPQNIALTSVPTFGGLTLSSGTDTALNIASTSATGIPYIQFQRNTSTVIANIQPGSTSDGSATGTGFWLQNAVAGGSIYFNISGTGNALTIAPTISTFLGASDTAVNVVSSSATGMPYLQWTRNTSTAIAYIQAGTNVSGNASSDGMLFVNNIAAGHYFFNISGTGNVLDLGPTTAAFTGGISATSTIQSTGSSLLSGQATGGSAGFIAAYSPTASRGYLAFQAANNAANYGITITNASFGQDTVVTIVDPLASTANLVLQTSGTFTPTLTCATPGDLSVVYGTRNFKWVRTGNVVTINGIFVATPTYTTATGDMRISGFPFTFVDDCGGGSIDYQNGAITWPAGLTSITPYGNGGTTYITLGGIGSATGSSNVQITGVTSTVLFTFQLTMTFLLV